MKLPADPLFSNGNRAGLTAADGGASAASVKSLEAQSAENSSAGKAGEAPLYYRLLFSLAILGLFLEWLLPLYRSGPAADTASLLAALMVLAAALLLWGLLRLPVYLQVGVQVLLILSAWLYVCIPDGELLWSWAGGYVSELPQDAGLLVTGKISQLSEDSRLAILTTGWGLLVASVQQLVLFRGSLLLFSAATVVYLLCLDIGFGLNTAADVVLAAGLIFWMHAMSGLMHLRLEESAGRSGRSRIPYARWGVMALAAALSLTAAAWIGGQLYGSKEEAPFTLQPVISRLQAWSSDQREEAELLQGASAGYGTGDGELGAPLLPSHAAVFTAESSQRSYWRGESRAYYDGRRWIRSGEAYLPLSLAAFPVSADPDSGRSARTLTQRVTFATPSAGGLPIFSAGTLLDVESIELTDGSRLGYVLSSPGKQSFRLPEISGSVRITGYTVQAQLPVSNPALLRGLDAADSPEIRSQYLQLPPKLPGRVAALAMELTDSAASRYDAAAAVREYLQSGYAYTLNTAVPAPSADFADDFLFGTRQGYCVHFATAMTVLLRSAGIPARYVQGYGPGTLAADTQPPQYAVTQGDAHAWVEVYFAGAGWVPFDPTPGSAAGLAAAADSAAPADAPLQAVPPAARRAGGMPALPQAGGGTAPPAAAAALLLTAAAWRWRRCLALLPAARSGGSLGRERQLRAAALAWRGLAARYGAPPPGLTGREYADSLHIDDAGLRAALRQFVRQWETLAYSDCGAAGLRSPSRPDSAAPGRPAPGSDPVAVPRRPRAESDPVSSAWPARVRPAPGSDPAAVSRRSRAESDPGSSAAPARVRPAPGSANDETDFIHNCLTIMIRLR
ncbi:transglutaminase-like domain-containing protein [Paenibacillus donghaensis]|nr:transglutaminase-like domain-containing protein [Paenibacillus donghaensis]